MRRVSSAPNVCALPKSIPLSGSSDKLDKQSSVAGNKVKVRSVQDLNTLPNNTLEAHFIQYTQSIASNKGIASVLCFENQTDMNDIPSIEKQDEEISSLASCLSTPLMEESSVLEDENSIPIQESSTVLPKRYAKSRRVRRWQVPSRIAKRV